MRVLIVGGTGFVGAHLAKNCVQHGHEVTITGRSPESSSKVRDLGGAVRALRVDTLDAASVLAAVEATRPERVFHLAGQSSVTRSYADEELCLRTNVIGTLHVLQAVRAHAPEARVLVVGSAEEYGRVPAEQQPILEDSPLAPVTPYGVSRVASSMLALRFALAEDLHVVRTRSFNHSGPGQSLDFVLPSWADQLVRARHRGEKRAVVKTGNLAVARDFSGVTAVAEAYRVLLETAPRGEVVNVCSGQARLLGDLLAQIGALAGVEPMAESDPARVRRVEIMKSFGDPARLEKLTGLSLASSLDPDLELLVRETDTRVAAASRGSI